MILWPERFLYGSQMTSCHDEEDVQQTEDTDQQIS